MISVKDLLQNPKYKEKFVLQKLLCLFLKCTREELWMDEHRELDDEMVQKISIAYDDCVIKKKPLEYVLGHVDFFGREFIVNEATLIPRPETEYMINSVTEFINGKLKMEDGRGNKNILLDIGTGCGVLGISVLLRNPGYFAEAYFTDYYSNALAVAKENYQLLVTGYEGKVKFMEADLLEFLNSPSALADTSPFKGKGVLDSNIILVANLPYIPEQAFEENAADNVKKWEPKPAFVAGEDGLVYYRIMFNQVLQLIENGKLKMENLTMFLEMMTRQVDILRQEFGERLEFEEVKTFHFNIRIVKAWLK